MKILFVAKHNSGDNQDEDAVTHALQKLGHEVVCVHEKARHRPGIEFDNISADLCLFFKWEEFGHIARISKRMPCVFWYFDMVDSDDLTLKPRCQFRMNWMRNVIPHCTVAFCTDGDWVNRDESGKLVHLMQGADERFIGMGSPCELATPILFTGMINHGQSRANHIAELFVRYGNKFSVLGADGQRGRVHGRQLANTLASAKIVVAPDGPNTDNYWSNRVYLTLGFGGFLLHPYCEKLTHHYTPDKELIYYRSRSHLNELIDQYIDDVNFRYKLQRAGFDKTVSHHTYRHRCEELIRIVKERI